MNSLTITAACIVLATSASSLLNADVLGEWNFNTGDTSAERLASSNLLAGVGSLSGLVFNDSFEDFGIGVTPSSARDGISFGSSQGEHVLFLDRANFFNGSTVPDPKPTAYDYTSWGDPATTAGGGKGDAPVSFTITAGAQAVTVESVTITKVRRDVLIFKFQEAGAAQGPRAVIASGNNQVLSNAAYLESPKIVAAGTSQTFTLLFSSQHLDSRTNIDVIQLNGTIDGSDNGYYAKIPESGTYAFFASLLALGIVALRRRRQC